jgi:hypothetical protein
VLSLMFFFKCKWLYPRHNSIGQKYLFSFLWCLHSHQHLVYQILYLILFCCIPFSPQPFFFTWMPLCLIHTLFFTRKEEAILCKVEGSFIYLSIYSLIFPSHVSCMLVHPGRFSGYLSSDWRILYHMVCKQLITTWLFLYSLLVFD